MSASDTPTAMPGRASGSATARNAPHGVRPKARATSSWVAGWRMKLARAVRKT